MALDGTLLLYNGKSTDNWHSVIYKDRAGWVSAKYGRLVV